MSKTLKEYFRYFPVSERGRQWGLYVTGAGFAKISPGSPYPPHGHPATHDFAWEMGRVLHEYALVYISAGAGRFESNPTGETPVAAGTVILLFPDIWHRYQPLNAVGWDEYWVAFAGDAADRLQARGFLRPEEPLLKTGTDGLVLHAFNALLDRMRAEPVGFEQLMVASFWEILASTLGAARREETGGRPYEMIRRAKLVLEGQTNGTPVIEELARSLGLSASRFQHLFKEHTGLSPYQYHLQLKVQRARELLRDSDMPVKQVAGMLGFQSVYHFSTLFKRKTGMSPTRWREVTQGKAGMSQMPS
jgi:AraC-like DNA-binding protein